MTSPKFSTWRPNQGTRSRVTFQLFATSRSDLFPQYLGSCAFVWRGSTWVWKKMASDKVCVFSRGKTAEKGSVSAQRSTWQSTKHLKIERSVSISWSLKKKLCNLHKIFLLMIFFGCRRAKDFDIVLCVWICNSELRHVRIFVTPCSFYVLKCVMEKHVVFLA